jgi:hypothetical protein
MFPQLSSPFRSVLLILGCTLHGVAATMPDAANVVWDSPSENALGSMPLGNGDIGANVWVEPSGDLVLLLSKTDAFDSFGRLLKIGRVRIQTEPALVQPGASFQQTLNLREGCIDIEAGETTVRVWIDAHHPVVQVDMEHTAPVTARASVELWRTETRMLDRRQGNEYEGHGTYENFPDMRKVHPDVILPHDGACVAWCQHNTESIWERNMRHTGLEAEIPNHCDPLLRRTFGAVMRGKGMRAESDLVLASAQPSAAQRIQIIMLTDFADSPADWRRAADELAGKTPADTATRFAAHCDWWRAFWERSWIAIDGGGSGLLASTGNAHPWRVGVDSSGANRFGGEIAGAKVEPGARTAFPEAADGQPSGGSMAALPAADVVLHEGLTVSAWIKPAAGEAGRIFDKVTAGRPDGCLFDTHPGLSLRWIVGPHTLSAPGSLKAGRWQHVAATADPSTGSMRMYLDGHLVKEEIIASPAKQVTQAYALQRFINAAAGRGHLPIKFNGTLFTADEVFDADYRRWGGPYWLQNTRLPYWSMLYSGDYDLMRPLFRMYRDQLPLRVAATKIYFGHDGAYYSETAHFWGNYADGNYGFNRGDLPHGTTQNQYIRRHWVGIIEIVGMMLDHYEATGDTAFRDDTLIPMAVETFRFYDQHWERDENGRIRYDPAQSLETYFQAVNPTPDIASMRYLIPRLLTLPVADDIRAEWERQLADQPELPITGNEGDARIAPAQEFGGRSNSENPELYAVFPFHLFTLATASEDDLQTAIRSFHARAHGGDNFGWNQSPVWAALLGLTEQAREMVVGRARNTARGYRFPGIYGPFYDWTPDQDHIGVFQIALQRMLMQCEGDRILLLPAWPVDWNVRFKLHAPRQTTVEGEVRDGRMVELSVIPESRRADVTLCAPFKGSRRNK